MNTTTNDLLNSHARRSSRTSIAVISALLIAGLGGAAAVESAATAPTQTGRAALAPCNPVIVAHGIRCWDH